MLTFIKQNALPIPIEYVEDEHDPEKDFSPSFWWNNHRYYCENFIRCHNNPWIGPCDFPEYIHAYEADNYCHPLFLELIDNESINVYEERSDE